MRCRVCEFEGDFNTHEVVTEVEVETEIEFDGYGEMYTRNRGEVTHQRITLSVCPNCEIVYMKKSV